MNYNYSTRDLDLQELNEARRIERRQQLGLEKKAELSKIESSREDTPTYRILRELEKNPLVPREENRKNRHYALAIFVICGLSIGLINYFKSQIQKEAPKIRYSLNQINKI